jgi:hypothetical protein
LDFGVPLEYDTSANESMHKPFKKASKMTQKAADTFTFQTAHRLVEFSLLDLAIFEIETGKTVWNYYDRFEPNIDGANETEDGPTDTGETRIKVFLDKDTGQAGWTMVTKSKFAEGTQWNSEIATFLLLLQDKIQATTETDSLAICTLHRRKGHKFRGHPNFRGKGPWRDWVWIDWGAGYGRLPSHIWCFVELKQMPTGRQKLEHGGIVLKDGVFAVVEATTLDCEEEIVKSDLLTPYLKEVEVDEDGTVQNRTFYLADTEAFLEPCCVIPDLGGPSNRCFVVKPRDQWAGEFIRWVQDEHTLDEMEPMDSSEEDEASQLEDMGSAKRKQRKRSRKTSKKKTSKI